MTRKFKEHKKPVGTVAELFAGVGGFRIGLERVGWKTVFSNQWEPSTKVQHASRVYVANFGESGHSSKDIATVGQISPKFDLLVGGFPCQDYSVAKSLNSSKGLKGKKGVLWWEILRIVKKHKPKLIFLENVDRLLKSPANQRGRDFAIMLRTLGDAGYSIEWRVVNAADYGFPQRRIRVFIVAKRKSKKAKKRNPYEILTKTGVLARALPAIPLEIKCKETRIDKDVEKVSRNFNRNSADKTPFLNTGFYVNGIAYSVKTKSNAKISKFKVLGDVVQRDSEIDDSFFIPTKQLSAWKYLKGAKSIERMHKSSGTKYLYAEGSMAFPDLLSNPSRTILTGEGGTSPSRFKHIIKTSRGYRRLTPVELERLNGFPDDWTRFYEDGNEVSATKRAFFMGNALVVGLVERVGAILAKDLKKNRSSDY